MMEILFRGKTPISNEWIYGDIIHNGVDENNCLVSYEPGDRKIYMVEIYDILCLVRTVLAETVGQYIGLTDKNGVKVFVGDIVRCSQGCPHEVIFEPENGGTFVGGMPTFYLSGLDAGYDWTGEEEVIGNIYDNKLEDFQ